jgi:hypothetical protein
LKTLLKLAAIFSLAVANGWLYGQSGHSVTLTVGSPDTSSTAPGTATILRANGSCPATGVPASGTPLSSTVTVAGYIDANGVKVGTPGTYIDSTVSGGSTYCYWSTLKTQGGGSGVSNTFLGSITVVVTVTGSVQ